VVHVYIARHRVRGDRTCLCLTVFLFILKQACLCLYSAVQSLVYQQRQKKCRLCNENQLDELVIPSLFRQSTSTCFGHICSPSSGGLLYIYSNWYCCVFQLTVCWPAGISCELFKVVPSGCYDIDHWIKYVPLGALLEFGIFRISVLILSRLPHIPMIFMHVCGKPIEFCNMS